MQIVVPMAGVGKRFLDAGYGVPKPLIKVHGKPMIEYIIDLFHDDDEFCFILNEEHDRRHQLRKQLESLKPGSKFVNIVYEQLGPVWGTLKASDDINDDEPTVVTYCDFNMLWDYDDFKNKMDEEEADGAILCYSGFHPHLFGPNKYAGVKTDNNNVVLEIKEKHSYTEDKMQSWHSNGTYYFKDGATVKKYFKKLVDSKMCHDNGEYYVSQVYTPMIEDGLKILLYPLDYFCQWGTPEDLEQYELWQSGLSAYELEAKIPHMKVDDHSQALEYWRAFNTKMSAKLITLKS